MEFKRSLSATMPEPALLTNAQEKLAMQVEHLLATQAYA
jgi:hypothetical protein